MVRQEQPLNAETPLNLLRRDFVTPGELFYVSNHGSLPAVDPATYRFTVSGLVERPLELSLEQLKSERLRVEMVATLCCAGNRRRELAEVRAMPEKISWDAGARLLGRCSLARSPPLGGGQRGGPAESGTGTNYGVSGPVEKGTSEYVLLAYEMNGEPLAQEHGFPLRMVVGGYIGARNVKRLSGISRRERIGWWPGPRTPPATRNPKRSRRCGISSATPAPRGTGSTSGRKAERALPPPKARDAVEFWMCNSRAQHR